MADEGTEWSGWTLLFWGCMFALSYLIGLGWLEGPRQWWHYLAALPLGLFWMWLFAGNGLIFLITWTAVPVSAIVLSYWLFHLGQPGWLSLIGLGYLSLSVLFRRLSRNSRSIAWTVNIVLSGLGGLALLVIGLVAILR